MHKRINIATPTINIIIKQKNRRVLKKIAENKKFIHNIFVDSASIFYDLFTLVINLNAIFSVDCAWSDIPKEFILLSVKVETREVLHTLFHSGAELRVQLL